MPLVPVPSGIVTSILSSLLLTFVIEFKYHTNNAPIIKTNTIPAYNTNNNNINNNNPFIMLNNNNNNNITMTTTNNNSYYNIIDKDNLKDLKNNNSNRNSKLENSNIDLQKEINFLKLQLLFPFIKLPDLTLKKLLLSCAWNL